MAFPAGRLPDSGEMATFAATDTPGRSIAFTSGGGDLDLTDPANKMTPCATDLFCGAGGAVVAQLAGDSAPRTYNMVAGQILRGLWVLIKSASVSCIVRQ